MAMRRTEFCDKAGITYRQLDNWTNIGYLLEGTGSNGSGRGNEREWSHAELAVARDIDRLTKAGVTLAVAARLARNAPEKVAGLVLMLEGS